MERPNSSWNSFCAQIVQNDLTMEVSTTFLSHEEQTTAELATLRQEIKKIRSEFRKYHVKAVAVTPRHFIPINKEDNNLPDSVITAIEKNIHLFGVAKTCALKKHEKYDFRCLLKERLLPYRTILLGISTEDHKTITPWTISRSGWFKKLTNKYL